MKNRKAAAHLKSDLGTSEKFKKKVIADFN